jgi:hypothetical protein
MKRAIFLFALIVISLYGEQYRTVASATTEIFNLDVKFDFNSAVIKKESYPFLNDIIGRKSTLKKMVVEGHTDSIGSSSYNRKLSQKRAESVKNYFVSKGVEASKIKAIGYGEEKLLNRKNSKTAHKQNRRVVIKIDRDEFDEVNIDSAFSVIYIENHKEDLSDMAQKFITLPRQNSHIQRVYALTDESTTRSQLNRIVNKLSDKRNIVVLLVGEFDNIGRFKGYRGNRLSKGYIKELLNGKKVQFIDIKNDYQSSLDDKFETLSYSKIES